ncbi:hypothetical protein LPJ61_000174 [Coemansia biformis]|uniref:Fungal-type protein kinase domain-containing protein n=1 Tax=Coemansia biformis TaxID=1286918 RepID=A0A9W8D0S7_9FUNG|nr:hypothetical protein LPJ61_000174 [Coemansia biformis]
MAAENSMRGRRGSEERQVYRRASEELLRRNSVSSRHGRHGELKSDRQIRAEEAGGQLEGGFLRFPHREVLEMARPRSPEARALSDVISGQAAASLEFLIAEPEALRIPGDNIRAGDRAVAQALREGGFSVTRKKPARVVGFVDALCGEFGNMWPLVVDGAHAHAESDMYRWMRSLCLFVAHHSWRHLRGVSGNGLVPRMVLPAMVDDKDADKPDSPPEPGFGLVVRSTDIEPSVIDLKFEYREPFALVRARIFEENPRTLSDPGYPQTPIDRNEVRVLTRLFLSVPELFASQYFRRFAWGITLYGTEARAFIFVNGGAMASQPMDLCTKAGRSELVRLLVDWSLGEMHLLGYDQTIVWLRRINCWRIDVPDALPAVGNSGRGNMTKTAIRTYKTVPYYFKTADIIVYELFGRHNRRFAATSIEPVVPVDDAHPIVPNALVKDTWSFVGYGSDGRCGKSTLGEIEFLLEIRDKLQGHAEMAHLPTIQFGGPVRMEVGGKFHLDTTDAILAPFSHEQPACPDAVSRLYAHNRYAMTPVGQPLLTARSPYETIIAMAGITKAIAVLANECRLLHNGISPDSVLLVRDDDGNVRGMLVDFDNALRTDSQGRAQPAPALVHT